MAAGKELAVIDSGVGGGGVVSGVGRLLTTAAHPENTRTVAINSEARSKTVGAPVLGRLLKVVRNIVIFSPLPHHDRG